MADGGDDDGRTSVERVSDPHIWTYTPVPPHAEGICDVCHNAPGLRYDGTPFPRCLSCGINCQRVTQPVLTVVPISLYVTLHQLHTVLRGYKDGPNEAQRNRWTVQVAAMIGRFMHRHHACIRAAVGDWDTITTVPTKRNRSGLHPLDAALAMLTPGVGDQSALLVPCPTKLDRLSSEHGYEPLPGASGRRVLLIDDTYTSGATTQSAATALARGGATTVAALVVGRVIDPGFTPQAAELWNRASARRFSFDACCLCDSPW